MWVELAVVAKPVPPFLRFPEPSEDEGRSWGGGGRDRGPAVTRPIGQSELSFPGVAAHSWVFLLFSFFFSTNPSAAGQRDERRTVTVPVTY